MKWEWLSKIFGWEGASLRVSGIFFEAAVQAALLFVLEIWYMTPHMGRSLSGFKHRLARHIKGRKPRRLLGGIWWYPPLEEVMQETWLEEMEIYVLSRHNTVAHYIAARPIMDLYEEVVCRSGMWVTKGW